jgi:Tol biopolymer transport system component
MHSNIAARALGFAAVASLAALLAPASPAGATSQKRPVTGLASVGTNGKTGNGASTGSALSTGGRFVAFDSSASNLVAGDGNAKKDVFVRDTLAGTTVLVSVATNGTKANGDSNQASISFNGRFVAFRSTADNLVANDTNGKADIFLRDLQKGTTVRASVAGNGGQLLGGDSSLPTVSSDGTEVLFLTDATNAVAGDANGKPDVFVRNLNAGFTERISVTGGEAPLTAGAGSPSMSSNGRYVVFDSATTQISGDPDASSDSFLRDRVLGTTEVVSIANNGTASNQPCQFPSVSDNGRYVAFQTAATGMSPSADAPGELDAFVRDRTTATTKLVDLTDGDQPPTGGGGVPQISADGSKVLFSSDSPDIVSGDGNGTSDIFLRDLSANTTVRTSVKTLGGSLSGLSYSGAISPHGTATSFTTLAKDAYSPDENDTFDVFVRHTFEIGPWSDSLTAIGGSENDFYGKNLTIGETVALNNKVLSGTATPASIIDDFAHATFDDARGPVMRLYWAFFHRMPDLNGLNFWVKKFEGGKTLKAIANEFAKSSEFKNKYGQVSNDQFITLVYQNVLERQPDAAGKAHWVGRLEDGVTRGEMMTAFSESSEGIRKMRGEIDSVLLAIGMLKRLPTPAEFTAWVNLLEGAGPQVTEVLVETILTSSAYAQRFAG